ncbi:hypothetical protein [Nitrosomonas eutropha]|nr:hypothetical protein [Nitrosomonas eutropha]
MLTRTQTAIRLPPLGVGLGNVSADIDYADSSVRRFGRRCIQLLR